MGALIKNWHYRPSLVPGEAFNSNFQSKDVRDMDVLSGKLSNVDYFIWGMNKPDYEVKIMSTGGGLGRDGCKEAYRNWTNGNESPSNIFYPAKPFHCYFHCCHVIDNHNNCWHSFPSTEDTLRTDQWSDHVFAFLLAVLKVNVYLVMCHFNWNDSETPTYLNFCMVLGWKLIDNPIIASERKSKTETTRRLWKTHNLLPPPRHVNY